MRSAMNYRIAVAVVLLFATSGMSEAQRRSGDDTLDLLASASIGDAIGDGIRDIVRDAQRITAITAEFNRDIAAKRRAFFAQYPDGPQLAEAELAFARALHEKDVALISMYVMVGGCQSGAGDARAQGIVMLTVDRIDGGVGIDSMSTFCEAVRVIKRELFHGGSDRPATVSLDDVPSVIAKLGLLPAVIPAFKAYEEYKKDRDLAEFSRAGLAPFDGVDDLIGSGDPYLHALGLLFTGRPGQSFSSSLRRTERLFDSHAASKGREEVLRLSERIMKAPRTKDARGYDVLADPASVGCVRAVPENCLYDLLSGKDPFAEEKTREIKAALEAAQVDPDDPEAQYRLGLSQISNGDFQLAIAAFERYLQIAPDGAYASQVKTFLALPVMKKQK